MSTEKPKINRVELERLLRVEFGAMTESNLDGRTPAFFWYDGKQSHYRESVSSGGMLIAYYLPDDDAPVVAGWGTDRVHALRDLHINMRLLKALRSSEATQ